MRRRARPPPDHHVARCGGGVGENFEPSVATNTRPIKKIALAGHSYVTRLQITEPVYQPWFTVRKFAAPGATVASFPNSRAWADLGRYRPDFTFLILGGNDIRRDTKVRDLVTALADLTLRVEDHTGGRCHVVGLEARSVPRDISPDRYRRIKNAVNRDLKRVPHILQRYCCMNMDPAHSNDGVHLDAYGSQQLMDHLLTRVREYLSVKDDEREGQDKPNVLDMCFTQGSQ